MNQLNSLIIEGKIKTMKVTETLKGFKVAQFNIIVTRNITEKEISEFSCESYGKMAEIMERLNAEGKIEERECRIVGRLKQCLYKDFDGKEHSRVYIVCEHVEFKPIKNK